MGNESHSRVLIVDDVKINSLILSSILTSYGITSDIAESGYECIDMCKQKTYDLILLDHRMPDYDGVDTLLQLKEIFKHQGHSIPVICHTTEDARQNVNLYKAAGFADILFKPIQPKELSEICKNANRVCAASFGEERAHFVLAEKIEALRIIAERENLSVPMLCDLIILTLKEDTSNYEYILDDIR